MVELLQKVVAKVKGDRDMMMFYMSNQAEREDWFEQGMEVGEERGRNHANTNTVLRMVNKGYDIQTIADVVDIDVNKVEEILHNTVA